MKGNKIMEEKDLEKINGGSKVYSNDMEHHKCKMTTPYLSDNKRNVNGEEQYYCEHCKEWFPASEFTIISI